MASLSPARRGHYSAANTARLGWGLPVSGDKVTSSCPVAERDRDTVTSGAAAGLPGRLSSFLVGTALVYLLEDARPCRRSRASGLTCQSGGSPQGGGQCWRQSPQAGARSCHTRGGPESRIFPCRPAFLAEAEPRPGASIWESLSPSPPHLCTCCAPVSMPSSLLAALEPPQLALFLRSPSDCRAPQPESG